jgi:hypothetical protein
VVVESGVKETVGVLLKNVFRIQTCSGDAGSSAAAAVETRFGAA